jgi:hypothetical protein
MNGGPRPAPFYFRQPCRVSRWACTGGRDPTVRTLRRVDGQNLLDTVNFNDTGSYLPSNVTGAAKIAQRNQALSLATTLDQYNNGSLC